MATHYLALLGHGAKPDTSGNVYQEPHSVNFGSNDRYHQMVWVFKDTSTKDTLGGRFLVPNNYVGSPSVVLDWATTVTTGNALWDFDYKAIADGESADPSADDENVTSGLVAVPGTARLLKRTTVSLTAGNFTALDQVQFHIGRDGVNETSGAAASLYLFDAYFKYDDA